MLEPSAEIHVFTAFSAVTVVGLALVFWRLHNKLAEVRAVVEEGRARDQHHRRLAMLGMVDWTLAMQHSGCVRLDLSSMDLQVELNTTACNRHACPPCFGLNATRGVKVHVATFYKCGEMLLGDTQRQLGVGTFQNALQPLEFINLSPDSAVAISDGTRDFLIPAGAHVRGACVAGSGDIHLNSSLRKHMRAGSTWSFLSDGSSSWNGVAGAASVVRPDGVVLVMGGQTIDGARSNAVFGSSEGGSRWARLTASAAWSPRNALTALVRLDGVLLVMGGNTGTGDRLNDVYGSADGGATWAQLTSAAAWSPRSAHAAVVCADGAVLVMGGQTNSDSFSSEVYGSEDGGATWSLRAASAAWGKRKEHSAVVRADGAVLIMGGTTPSGRVNDVYNSEDGGVTWTLLTASAAWSPRQGFAAVVRADGAVLVLGGKTSSGRSNDVYASDTGGTTWYLLTAAAAWNPRNSHTAVVRGDGAVLVLTGGEDAGRRVNSVYVSEA